MSEELKKKVNTLEKQVKLLTTFVFKLIRGSDKYCKYSLVHHYMGFQCFHPDNIHELAPCNEITTLKDCPMFKRAGMVPLKKRGQ